MGMPLWLTEGLIDLLRHETSKRGIRLYIPPFTRGRNQLSYVDAEDTRTVAYLRIDVERAIKRIKSFHILDASHLILDLVPLADQIFSVCAFMTNFQTPLRAKHTQQSQPAKNMKKQKPPLPGSLFPVTTPQIPPPSHYLCPHHNKYQHSNQSHKRVYISSMPLTNLQMVLQFLHLPR